MMRCMIPMGLLAVASVLVACSSATTSGLGEPPRPAACQDPPRPQWANTVPETDSNMYFVGLSAFAVEEQDARGGADDNSIDGAVKWAGSDVFQKVEKARIEYRVTSDLGDPVRARREFERIVRKAFVQQYQGSEYYTECELRNIRWAYKVLVKGSFPKSAMDRVYANALRDYAKTLTGDQADAARRMFEDLANQGMTAPDQR